MESEVDTMAEEGPDDGLHNRKPACDCCKARKTRCDRKSPCSTCATARIPCLTTRKPPERRQRVLLSSKYEDALENINSKLEEVSKSLKFLADNGKTKPTGKTSASPQSPRNSSHDMIDGDDLTLRPSSDGYRGDSSFAAHVKTVAEMLEIANANPAPSRPAITSTTVHELLLDVQDRKPNTSTPRVTVPQQGVQTQFQELTDLPLPPTEPILKLLRWVTLEKHRFFVDVPIFDEQEFVQMCRQVYFPIEQFSSLTWSIVNVGLLYLLHDLRGNPRYGQIGMSLEDMRMNIKQLSANAEIAIRNLKLCLEPSVLACKALGFLGLHAIKTGQSSIAWRLMTTATRMCLDMGFHRLPTRSSDSEAHQERQLFWWVHSLEKELAFTFGRTPTIHMDDITTQAPIFPRDYRGLPRYYTGYYEYAIIAGEIHQQLFSASSQREPRDLLVRRARILASELTRIQNSLQPKPDDPPLDSMFMHAAIILDIIMYSLQAVVYRIIPPDNSDAHPLQCCQDCVDASRKAITMLVQVGEGMRHEKPYSWAIVLNMIICLVPFVSFLALIGNTIALASDSDMTLLSSVLLVIEPVAEKSPAAQKIFEVCQKFYRIAEILTSGDQKPNSKSSFMEIRAGNNAIAFPNSDEFGLSAPVPVELVEGGFPMSQQDWDYVMKDFEMGLGDVNAGEMAMFIEPYM